MTRKIPLIAHDLKRLYTGFLLAAVLLFAVCTYLTQFNPMVLAANGDAFWEFITEDFLPPALPKASRIPGIFSSVLVTLALAMSATTVAAILAFFVALFGSEKVSPFPRFAKVVRGFATFLRNIPALVCGWGTAQHYGCLRVRKRHAGQLALLRQRLPQHPAAAGRQDRRGAHVGRCTYRGGNCRVCR